MKRSIDIFRRRQFMMHPDYELYQYSDPANLHVIPHSHDFYEIYYFLSEQLDFIIGNKVYHLKRGDFLLLPPGLMHYPSRLEQIEGKSYDRIVLWCSIACFEKYSAIDPELNYIWDAVKENRSYHLRPPASSSQTLKAIFLRLIDENQNPGRSNTMMANALLAEIFVQINRIIYELAHFQQNTPVITLFNNILYYIHTHLTEDLSLENLAQHFFASKGYISRVFKEYMNVSVHQYILSLRLEGARKAILGGAPIAKASEAYSFTDYSSFYRAFKKAYDVSPREYHELYHSTHAN